MFPNEGPYVVTEPDRMIRPRTRDDELSFCNAVMIESPTPLYDSSEEGDLDFRSLETSICSAGECTRNLPTGGTENP